MKINPCYGCDNRHENCHSRCIDYKDWKKYQSKVNKERHKDDEYVNYVENLIEKNRR